MFQENASYFVAKGRYGNFTANLFFSSLLRSRFGMQNFLRGSVSYLHEPRINTFEDADECDILRIFLELLICNSKRRLFWGSELILK